jgi:hypothetical protein
VEPELALVWLDPTFHTKGESETYTGQFCADPLNAGVRTLWAEPKWMRLYVGKLHQRSWSVVCGPGAEARKKSERRIWARSGAKCLRTGHHRTLA